MSIVICEGKSGPLESLGIGVYAGYRRIDDELDTLVEEKTAWHVVDQNFAGLLVVCQSLVGVDCGVALLNQRVKLLVAVTNALGE